MAMGKTLITHNWGGLADFVNKNNAIVYSAYQSIVYDQQHSDPYLYTGLEEWAEPNDHQLMVAMRTIHEAIKQRGEDAAKFKMHLNSIQAQAIQDTRGFDVRAVGPKLYQELKTFYDSWKEKGFVEVDPSKQTTVQLPVQKNE